MHFSKPLPATRKERNSARKHLLLTLVIHRARSHTNNHSTDHAHVVLVFEMHFNLISIPCVELLKKPSAYIMCTESVSYHKSLACTPRMHPSIIIIMCASKGRRGKSQLNGPNKEIFIRAARGTRRD